MSRQHQSPSTLMCVRGASSRSPGNQHAVTGNLDYRSVFGPEAIVHRYALDVRRPTRFCWLETVTVFRAKATRAREG